MSKIILLGGLLLNGVYQLAAMDAALQQEDEACEEAAIEQALHKIFELCNQPIERAERLKQIELELRLGILSGDSDMSPLYAAALKGDHAEVKNLLSLQNATEEVNRATKSGWVPLHVAAVRADCAMIIALLAAGASKNPVGSDGSTPLHWAAGLRDGGAAVRLLLASGAKPSEKGVSCGSTPLHLVQAADVAEALIAGGADLEARDKKGQTPLYNAVFNVFPDVVDVMCARGANLEAVADDGIMAMGAYKPELFNNDDPEAVIKLREVLFKYWQALFKRKQAEIVHAMLFGKK